MKHNLENIPEVSIDKVDAFYVTGTQHRDAAGKTNNLKLNLKTLGGGSIDLTDKEALKALWDALQDAIAIVITEADVVRREGTEVEDPAIYYEVMNTEGFPTISSPESELAAFSPKVVGTFMDADGVEVQTNLRLSYEEISDSDVFFRGSLSELTYVYLRGSINFQTESVDWRLWISSLSS